MSANVWLGAMVAVSVAAVATSSRWERKTDPPFQRTPPETPWLTPELAAQIVGPDGGLGPLFHNVELGGIVSAAARARIAAFARTHNIDIDLEVVDEWLVAVRFEVMFGGCCGYEGADTLALRLNRVRCQCCGCEKGWLDDWVFVTNGVFGRARVRVNRLTIRWEREATIDELVDRAESLLGRDRVTVAKEAAERWVELEPNRRYAIQMPYVLDEYWIPNNTGIEVVLGSGRIVEARVPIRQSEMGLDTTMDALRARWGRPRVHHNEWTWRTPDRVATADLESWKPALIVRMR